MSGAASIARRIVPLFDRVLVQRMAAETRSKGGILIPEKARAKGMEATVVAVGPGYRNETGNHVPMSVQVGDKVLLPEFGGNKLEMEGNEFHMFRETDIVAKMNN
eukprot:TRINITY_DN1305_c0_g2_i1.p1 TRINITY_DN1305_c0_g2~~TRINITY_DN1305_c0_g2_i1.p1  ORF type:complete len:119 (+),score=33.66 TRINITY_DN1305_c0_g2_i1:45-359(+)